VQILGYELSWRKALPLRPLSSGREGGWYPIVRESFTGAWQQNVELRGDALLTNPTVFTCVTRISQDIAKLPLRLVEQDPWNADIWTPTTNPAYSPVLRKPNHYQTIVKFIEQWQQSKLIWGNTYVLKRRDARGVVSALYILNPQAVTVLVASDGSVFYQLKRPEMNVTGAWSDTMTEITVPAREIIHDRINCLFHPLVGLPPLYAAGMPAALGSTILKSSTQFFANGSQPSGTLSAANEIKKEQADKIKQEWQTLQGGVENTGKIAVLGYGLKYEPVRQTAVDAQLTEQAGQTEIEICKCFGFPVALLNSTKGAPYGTHEQLVQLYHDECLQPLLIGTETALDEGIGIDQPVNGTQYGTEFDIDDLYWMDTATRTKAAADSVGSGVLSPNEARLKYFGLGPVTGGDSPVLQQQYYSLAALAERDKDKPFAKPTPATPASSPDQEEPPPGGDDDEAEDDRTEDEDDDDKKKKKKPRTN
jgi:HK97 family phage portal protein